MTYSPIRAVLALACCLTLMIPAGTYGPAYSPARRRRAPAPGPGRKGQHSDVLTEQASANDRPALLDEDAGLLDGWAPGVGSTI